MTMVSDEMQRGPSDEKEPQELEPAELLPVSAEPAANEGVPPSEAKREEPMEFEELESVDEEEGAALELEGEAAEADKQAEFDALVKSGTIKTWSIENLQRLVEEGRSAIVMENGVFRIKEEVYTAGEKVKKGQAESTLREIAHEVVHHEAEAAAPDTLRPGPIHEESGLGGIGDLIQDEDSIDLSKVVSVEKGAVSEQTLTVDREKTNPIQLKRNGLDYDEFLSSYPRSFTHTTQMKSLVEVSRRVSAVSAGLFLKKIQGYAFDLTVGLGEKSVQNFHFDANEPFYSSILLARKAVALDKAPAEVRFLKGRLEQEDLRYMRRILFLPATFRGQEAYLFLSFTSETDIALNAILSKLIVQ